MRASQLTALRDQPATAPSLDALTALFGRLHAEGIRYCHWKSNEHLRASMLGATDLDLLVDRTAAASLARTFADLAVKRFPVRPFHVYPGIEDYVAFDRRTGTLSHVHVHYQLTVGEKVLKSYRLPWEELVLATRSLDERGEIYVADPHIELLLLVIRAALKLRTRDRLRALGGTRSLRENVQREFRWLVARIDRDRLYGLAGRLVGDKAAARLVEMTASPPPSTRQLLAFRTSVEPPLATYRMYGALEARWRRWRRELALLWWKTRCRLAHVPARSSRSAPQGSVKIVLVGADEAGKATLAQRLSDWLSWELAVVPPHPAGVARRARGLAHVAIVAGGATASRDAVPPDLVVRLRLPRARRVGAPAVELRRQSDVLDGQRFPGGTRVVAVDAAQPLEHVELLVKGAIWESL